MELTLFFAKFVAFEGIGVGRGMGMGSMSIYYFAQRLEENYFSSFFSSLRFRRVFLFTGLLR